MPGGLVIPSILQRDMQATRLTLQELSDRSKWDGRGIHRLGNGLLVTQDGKVIVEPRSQAPTQTEQEDMQDKFRRFQEFLKSEGASEIASERKSELVEQTADPNIITPPGGFTPSDLAYEFGTPIDTTEIITMCEETGLYTALPEVVNGSKIESWREMTELYNASGTSFIGFAAGACPDFTADTTEAPLTITKKHIGKMESLTQSDITHTAASIAAGYGVKELVGPYAVQGGPSMLRESIKDLMDKEIKKTNILILNAWDYLLVHGNATARPLEFNGFENYVTAANGAHTNVLQGQWSGTFSTTRFDEWIAASCVKPTHIFAHPTALQALKLGYWGLGSQTVNWTGPGANVAPGLTFADVIQTSVGPLPLVCDSRFTRTNHGDGSFTADLFLMRMVHNGEPLVYKATQIPLSFKELPAGCSAVSFEIWAVTALVIKWMCAHGRYTSKFQGKVFTSDCNYVFGQ